MRILVVGRAAFGEVTVIDRLDGFGRPRHLIGVLADEDLWERPPLRDRDGLIVDPGQPHDVFSCTSFDQAVRYLRGLPFDLVFADDSLGERVLKWMTSHLDELPKVPRAHALGHISQRASAVLEGSLDVRPVQDASVAALRDALRQPPG